jgi:hypothetical protein
MTTRTAAQGMTLEDSFLNPTWANGAAGGVGVARRRVGVLIAALLAGEETHPVMSDENIRVLAGCSPAARADLGRHPPGPRREYHAR